MPSVATPPIDDPQPWREAAAFAHRLARALVRDAALAQDVAQDVMLQALQRGGPRGRGWLATVTRRLAGRALRERRVRPQREAVAGRPEATEHERQTAARLQLQRQLVDATAALPEPYRTVVTLRWFDDLPPRAIARRLGVSGDTVRQQLHRGLALLRARLDREHGGRGRWLAAVAGIGLGGAAGGVPTALLVLTMKKTTLVVAAAASVLGTAWWLARDPRPEPPPTLDATASAADPAGAATRADPAGATAKGAAAAAAPVPARTEFALRVEVVDERRQPRPRVDVWCWRPGAAAGVEHATTDGDGRVELTPHRAAGRLLLAAPARPPRLEQLAALQGEHTFVLAYAQRVAGRVLVDGERAPAGVRIGLSTAGLQSGDDLPEPVARILGGQRGQCFARTDQNGEFTFAGLADDWRGSLCMPSTHWLLPAPGEPFDPDRSNERLDLHRPATDLVLATTQLPTIAGRVVWDDDGSPVPYAGLDVHAVFADGQNTPLFGIRADERGHFGAGCYPGSSSLRLLWCDPARRPAFASASLSASGTGSDGEARVKLDASQLPAHDVEMRLRRAAITHFVVQDPHGRPIAGARISVEASKPTDVRGRGSFRGARQRRLVGADGYMVVPAEPRGGTGTEQDPLRFALPPRNDLVVRVRDRDGRVPAVQRLRIDSPTDLFAGERHYSPFHHSFGGTEGNTSRRGMSQPDGSTRWYEWTCTAIPDAQGLVTLHSLEPGLACTVSAIGALKQELARTTFTTPDAGADCRVELVVDERPRTVGGRVLAGDGTPLGNAAVWLTAGDEDIQTGADGDGRFRFEAVYTEETLRLLATADGHVAQERAGLTRAQDGLDHEFRLAPGRTVTVRVVDEHGELVPLWPEYEGRTHSRHTAQMLEPGVHRWNDLPATATFAVTIGHDRHELRHDAAQHTATLVVPTPARVRVAAPDGFSEPHHTEGHLRAEARRQDQPAEPLLLDLGGKEDALLPAGRYRFDLVLREWQGERAPGRRRELVTRPLGPSVTVDLPAGELTRVQLPR